jgi:Uma2 family endonuclease
VVLAAETGFHLVEDPDTVLAADVSFVSKHRYDSIIDEVKFIPFAPDMAVEVLSPSHTFPKAASKALAWLAAGTKLVLLVDPEKGLIWEYRSDVSGRCYMGDEQLDCSGVVPDWSISFKEIA